jgi:hypothetical protein
LGVPMGTRVPIGVPWLERDVATSDLTTGVGTPPQLIELIGFLTISGVGRRYNSSTSPSLARWNFLTNHGQALLCIAADPEVRLSDIAATLEITDCSACSIVKDLTDAGYVVKTKEGRRIRYQIRDYLMLPEKCDPKCAPVGEILNRLVNGRG